uniref:Uncharacterized protein n=1 Tax=Oryza barthii TaxID=65489 RepID=A0A0D3HSI3_9ORYZ
MIVRLQEKKKKPRCGAAHVVEPTEPRRRHGRTSTDRGETTPPPPPPPAAAPPTRRLGSSAPASAPVSAAWPPWGRLLCLVATPPPHHLGVGQPQSGCSLCWALLCGESRRLGICSWLISSDVDAYGCGWRVEWSSSSRRHGRSGNICI